ncbi:MAG: hypothetical protein B6I36_04255 [Desulfobacteraceae bacterium 4572_35.1]|nr:MAG: hypothetical protein B6I36_04255 [Desulfobacteraceae bacterium 4572_35.1]
MNNRNKQQERKTLQQRQQILEKIRHEHAQQQTSYREQALKMFPWVCARCTREFNTKNVRELTVHHKDHNHDNNPGDGSNWELLCIYCHDEEHSREIQQQCELEQAEGISKPTLAHSPFAALKSKLNQRS